MNEQQNNNTSLQTAAGRIDTLAKAAFEAFIAPDSFGKELAVAAAVNEMRAALSAEVMSVVVGLMNTSIGFDTDRNPKKNPTDREGKPTVAYDLDVVRDCFIESRLRGFHLVGKEFSIIAGNFYGGVNGFDRLVKTNPKVTNFRDWYDVPRTVGENGALVKCKAEWNQENVAQSLEREFAIRVNKGQGADAILGKAKRKLLAAVHSRLTGAVVPEGEVGEELTNVTPKTAATSAASADELFKKGAAPATATAPTPTPTPQAATEATPLTPQADLARFMAECEVSFEHFKAFVVLKNLSRSAEAWVTFDDVPAAFIPEWQKLPKLAAELIRKFGKVK